MPLINGQKMACEPCIRGHRSTKCTHASERLMVPVRKPGRPLSTCPHPASRPCSCGQVTAAIPKKQKCHCGPKNGDSILPKTEMEDSSKETTPQSPSKANNPTHRIQKNTSKSGSSSRKQSVDLVGLERMDPNQLNIMPGYNGITPKPTPPLNGAIPIMPDMSTFGAMGMAPAETPFGPMMFPMFQPQMPPPMLSPETTKNVPNGNGVPLANGTSSERIDKPAPKLGSCCGGGGGTSTPPTQPSTAASSPNGTPSRTSDGKTKSCCSSGIDSPTSDTKTGILPSSGVPTPNNVMISPFQTPIMMPNGMYGYYPQPTVFTYPPQYGSYMQPLQPEQWRQVMSSVTFGQGAMPSPYGIPGSIPYHTPSAMPSSAGTSHQCSCGDSCQCVGCAAHPYNEATQSYVRSAWETMLDDNRAPGHTAGNQSRSHSHINGNGGHETPITNGLSNGNAIAHASPTEETKSPTGPQTPSDTASGLSEEQTLSANDFFFVSYPFGDACAGEMASCPCGDDCQCLGCAIHNNPGPISETVH